MSMQRGLLPSLLVPEVYSPWKTEPGFVVQQIERVAGEGFFRSVEISRLPTAADRDSVRRICDDYGIYVSSWLTEIIDAEKLDLTSVDATLQQRSVEVIKRALPEARASGSRTVAMIGGPDPGPALRERGYDSFYRSMNAICIEAANLGMTVMFEPLDRFAHKKRLIGPTDEVIAAFARVRAEHPSFGLAFDTAHAALNEEDIGSALDLAKDQVVNLHLSNAVLDKDDPLYGDHHIMPGAPGFLTIDRAASIVARTLNLRIAAPGGLRISVEARAKPDDGRQTTASVSTAFLKAVLMRAEELK